MLASMVLANGFETLPSLRADVDAITAAAARLGDCRLIVIDPVSAYQYAKRGIGALAQKRGFRAGAQWTWQLPAHESR